jgi:tetratricopeptide (TPR) repeat protein
MILTPCFALANMILPAGEAATTVFFTHKDVVGLRCHVKGVVISFSNFTSIEGRELIDTVQEKNRVITRLYSTSGIKKGDTLYVVDNENLVVSRMTADTIFNSVSFGPLLVGNGNFTLATTGYRVVQKIEDEQSSLAFIHKSRGDYHREMGDRGNAVSEYKKALALDRGSPDTHLALGDIYYEKKLYQFAFREYEEGYRNISRLHDREDRFLLIQGMVRVRYKEFFEGSLPVNLREGYRRQGIALGNEALEIYADSAEMNHMLGMFHYRSPEDDDTRARDCFLRVLEIEPDHVGAAVALSELYFKHKNRDKALVYAEKALRSDPSHKRARELLLYIERYNQ